MLAQIRPVIPDAPIGEAARGQRPISGARLSGIGLVAATRNSDRRKRLKSKAQGGVEVKRC